MSPVRFTPVAVCVAVLVGLSACGSNDTAVEPAATGGATVNVVVLNAADVEFAQGMIAHHEQAIEMAEIALDQSVGARSEIVDLATRIKAAQDTEVETMTAWLNAAGESLSMDTSDGHDMMSMPGMMSAEAMDGLATMTGAEFDRTWLEMMIEHHEGAIIQAEAVKAAGSNPEVLALAEEIIAAQRAEIEEMTALLG